MRAFMALKATRAMAAEEIAELLGCDSDPARRSVHRDGQEGIAGLGERPRSARCDNLN